MTKGEFIDLLKDSGIRDNDVVYVAIKDDGTILVRSSSAVGFSPVATVYEEPDTGALRLILEKELQ